MIRAILVALIPCIVLSQSAAMLAAAHSSTHCHDSQRPHLHTHHCEHDGHQHDEDDGDHDDCSMIVIDSMDAILANRGFEIEIGFCHVHVWLNQIAVTFSTIPMAMTDRAMTQPSLVPLREPIYLDFQKIVI